MARLSYAVILLCLAVLLAVWWSITWRYPMAENCRVLRDYSAAHGHFPSAATASELVSGVRFFSVLKYERTDAGFEFYFCPTRLGPCEVCSESGEPRPDEI
jgi:hypothetical protein